MDIPKGAIVVIGCGVGASVMARRILESKSFEEVAAVGWKDDFKKRSSDKYEGLKKIRFMSSRDGNDSLHTDALIEQLKNEIKKSEEERFVAALGFTAVGAHNSAMQLRDILSRFKTPEKITDLTIPEPKCGKFHNNLRSQLNTGGIKWMK